MRVVTQGTAIGMDGPAFTLAGYAFVCARRCHGVASDTLWRTGGRLLFSIVLLSALSGFSPAGLALDSTDETHSWHKNHVSAFVGGMAPVHESKETSLALGLSYERR